MRKRALIVAVALVVAAIAAVVVWPGPKEPQYQGKKLSEWVGCQPGPVGYMGNPGIFWRAWVYSDPASIAAVWHTRTSCIPFMIKWVGYERPRWKDRVCTAYWSLPRRVLSKSAEQSLGYGKSERLADGAMSGFATLGSYGAPAVPELIEILKRTRNAAAAERVILCLGCIGPEAREALPTLREFSERSKYRVSALAAIRRIDKDR